MIGATALLEPPGRLTVQIDPGSPPVKVTSTAEVPGRWWPTGVGKDRRTTPTGPVSGAALHRPEAEPAPVASSAAIALLKESAKPAPSVGGRGSRTSIGVAPTRLVLFTPGSSVPALSRTGEAGMEAVPGVSASRAAKTGFYLVEYAARPRTSADLYPLQASRPSGAGLQPAMARGSGRSSRDVVSSARAAPAGSDRRMSLTASRPRTADIEAQILRGQLEQDVETMLRTRLSDLRRR